MFQWPHHQIASYPQFLSQALFLCLVSPSSSSFLLPPSPESLYRSSLLCLHLCLTPVHSPFSSCSLIFKRYEGDIEGLRICMHYCIFAFSSIVGLTKIKMESMLDSLMTLVWETSGAEDQTEGGTAQFCHEAPLTMSGKEAISILVCLRLEDTYIQREHPPHTHTTQC